MEFHPQINHLVVYSEISSILTASNQLKGRNNSKLIYLSVLLTNELAYEPDNILGNRGRVFCLIAISRRSLKDMKDFLNPRFVLEILSFLHTGKNVKRVGGGCLSCTYVWVFVCICICIYVIIYYIYGIYCLGAAHDIT